MSIRDPLWELQKSLYTRLDTVVGVTVYDFLPDPCTYPYVLMETERSAKSEAFKDSSLSACTAQLLLASTEKGGQEMKQLVDDIATAMETKLTLADSWTVVRQSERPQVVTRRVAFNDGKEGRIAQITFTFDIQDTA